MGLLVKPIVGKVINNKEDVIVSNFSLLRTFLLAGMYTNIFSKKNYKFKTNIWLSIFNSFHLLRLWKMKNVTL